MHQPEYLKVSGLLSPDTDTHLPEKKTAHEHLAFPCIGLLLKNQQLAANLTGQLSDLIKLIPIVAIKPDSDGQVSVRHTDVFLVSDWDLYQLKEQYNTSSFASVMLLTEALSDDEVHDMYCYLEIDEQLGEKVTIEVMSRLFPAYEEKRLQLESRNKQQLQLLDHIGRELSVFYHNINNPLTILSGNIQLLQMLTDTINVSADLLKPITDIATVSTRFEQDLRSIAELKEKIKAGNLQKDPS